MTQIGQAVRKFVAVDVNGLPSGMVTENYDYIEMSYTGDDLTSVVFKRGGASGVVVATLTLTYSGGKLVSVEKT